MNKIPRWNGLHLFPTLPLIVESSHRKNNPERSGSEAKGRIKLWKSGASKIYFSKYGGHCVIRSDQNVLRHLWIFLDLILEWKSGRKVREFACSTKGSKTKTKNKNKGSRWFCAHYLWEQLIWRSKTRLLSRPILPNIASSGLFIISMTTWWKIFHLIF